MHNDKKCDNVKIQIEISGGFMKKNKEITIDKTLPKNLPLMFQDRAYNFGTSIVQAAKNKSGKFEFYTYKQVYKEIIAFAVKLRDLGIKRSDAIGIISDNRREWMISDFAIMSLGACNVPRGCDSMGNEIRFILSYAGCKVSFFENAKQLQKVLDDKNEVPLLHTAILFDSCNEEMISKAANLGIKVYFYNNLLEDGKNLLDKDPHLKAIIESEMQMTDGDEVATMIFTSGTTGTPKGVMLTHRNFLAQLEIIPNVLPAKENEMWMSVLPIWHSFERCIQYIVIALKSGVAYSKPVASVMLSDFATIKPQWMCGVPRLWESLVTGVYRSMKKTGGIKYAMFKFFISVGKKYSWLKSHLTGSVCQFKRRLRFLDVIFSAIPFLLLYPLNALGDVLVFKKIREKLGGKFVAAISGGGALQKEVDEFYSAIGFKLLEGYGMTETAPILSLRNFKKNRKGCVGEVLPCVEIKIVSESHGKIVSSEPLPPGKKGLIMARGDQIMKGYFNRPDLTEQIIDKDGWLNTGDLGMLSYDNEIKITGRAKDTIVLLGGENIEPAVIESELKASTFIESVVVLGQDKKYLAALIVPEKDAVMEWAAENGVPNEYYEGVLESAEVKNLIQSEIDNKINSSKSFRTCERIYKFALLQESFKVGEELSAKQEMMRHKIAEKYSKQIEGLFEE